MKSTTDRITYRGLLSEAVRDDREYSQLLEAIKTRRKKNLPYLVSGLCEGAADALALAICEDMPGAKPVLLLCAEEKDCTRLRDGLVLSGLSAVYCPSREPNFHDIVSSREYEQSRLDALMSVRRGTADAIITTPDAFLRFTMPPETLDRAVTVIRPDSELPPDRLCEQLVSAGYVRSEMAEGPGQFARRGGIIDVCLPDSSAGTVLYDGTAGQASKAVRVEFFGDEIDRLAAYDPQTQRVIENTEEAVIPPAREVIPTQADLEAIRASIKALQKKAEDVRLRDELAHELASAELAISSGAGLNFADKYVSLIYPGKNCLADYLPEDTLCVMIGSSAVNDRTKFFCEQSAEDAKALTESGMLPGKYAEFSAPAQVLNAFTASHKTVMLDSLAQGVSGMELGGVFGFRSKHSVSCAENADLLREELENFIKGGYRVLVMASGETQAKNYEGLIKSWDIPAQAASQPDGRDIPFSIISPGSAVVLPAAPAAPFELPTPRIAVISLGGGSGRAAAKAPRKNTHKDSSAKKILSYADLHVGDYVVHENHGIGIFMGITTLKNHDGAQDYITIQFAGTDKLFMPVDKLDKVSKYIGAHSDDGTLRLSKFGGAEWGKTKARAKASLKNIAKELIALYAERMRRPGFAFPPDEDFQRDFEAAFEYEETDAQLQAAAEIKGDMIKNVPMDRLLCGDVGYGKTEVAFRAIYKAILGGKQAALLVPTTILAMQHYQSAVSRMRSFPVKVEMISRFRSPKEQKKIIAGVEKGDVDLIIGTHRLLSQDIKFKDLGLLVVDEEQRFGVAQKEKIKQRAGNIDVLSLSATPIPRTLNMAMTGIRDISLLDEAPCDRLPVQTYVLEHDDLIIIEAVKRELRRGGQVFYLYNYVESIESPAAKLRAAIPDARIVTAHGKMDKEQLEDIWRGMIDGEIDVLVCTTIIETGVDVPNANTLIVENAHRMGLSQLHQLRGRVGRSPRRAYAYFTFPRGRALSEISTKRLEAIRDYAEFGAGFRIAMRDMEIRGAGSVLGAEQHGHLDSIGYDLYVRLLGEAVLEEKGEAPQEKPECTVSLSENAYLPDSYVPSPAQRMALYKRIAHVENKADRDDIFDELLDRFGELPPPAETLLDISLIRAMASQCGATAVTQNGREVRVTLPDIDVPLWQKVADRTGGRLRIVFAADPVISVTLRQSDRCIEVLSDLFRQYLRSAAEKGAEDRTDGLT